MTGKFIAYYRVSTAKQGASGLGLEAQRTAVLDYLNGGRWKLVAEITEIESGKNNDRPALEKALAACRVHKATLVVAKLDRLARNVAFVSALMEGGVDFVCCDVPSANRFTVHVLAAAAENEAHAISERTKAALKAAKRRGVKLGGDRGNLTDKIRRKAHRNSVKARQLKAAKHASDLMPIIEDIRATGASTLREIAAELNERGIPAARGGEWQAGQVKRVLDIADIAEN
jgi:DNA invertase Pin-like site-specific DNA recombinase